MYLTFICPNLCLRFYHLLAALKGFLLYFYLSQFLLEPIVGCISNCPEHERSFYLSVNIYLSKKNLSVNFICIYRCTVEMRLLLVCFEWRNRENFFSHVLMSACVHSCLLYGRCCSWKLFAKYIFQSIKHTSEHGFYSIYVLIIRSVDWTHSYQ